MVGEVSMEHLVFGHTGSLGAACVESLVVDGSVHRGKHPFEDFKKQIASLPRLDSVIWANGVNINDSIMNFEFEKFQEVLTANLNFIIQTAHLLIAENKINQNANFIIISSIWSKFVRRDKLSYTVSKSAVSGLTRSLAADLGKYGIHVNSIAPGPIDNKMSRLQLPKKMLKTISSETPLGRLVTEADVARIIKTIASGNFRGVTGQDIFVDGGWGMTKLV